MVTDFDDVNLADVVLNGSPDDDAGLSFDIAVDLTLLFKAGVEDPAVVVPTGGRIVVWWLLMTAA